MARPHLKVTSKDDSVDDSSSDHEPKAGAGPDTRPAPEPQAGPERGAERAAVARLRALQSAFAAVQPGTSPESDPDADATPPEHGEADSAELAPDRQSLRILEAVLFASDKALTASQLAAHLPAGSDVKRLLDGLKADYAGRGVALVPVAGRWAFRTAEDLSYLLESRAVEERRLSRAGLETLAIVAYHQPVTRAEIEAIRGVATSKGTLDVLMETGWIRPRGRRRAPGKPITYGTTDNFLEHFGLDALKDLPGLAELKGTGLLDGNLPPEFTVPEPRDIAALMPDELPLEDASQEDTQALLSLEPPTDDNGSDDGDDLDADEVSPLVPGSDGEDASEPSSERPAARTGNRGRQTKD